ncbi:MAG: hypothetical protein BVN32_09010 [Proteobacteria bacterium ST_bin14]|nr:MAG: hypothetical protein BVN32_09010 [Proteobacteria bacterium ST_bin14]
MTQHPQNPTEIFFTTDDGRRFRAVLDHCDSCAALMTQDELRKISVLLQATASDDNVVFSCSTCVGAAQVKGENVVDRVSDVLPNWVRNGD